MIKPGADVALLSPAGSGWRLRVGGGVTEHGSLEAAAAAVPARAPVHLALPCHLALLERLTLPSRERAELEGMAQLQLEKTLPYPVEEVSSALEIVRGEGEESVVLSMAVHTPALEELCQPLRAAGRLPARISLFAQAVAGEAAEHERALLLWPEEGHLVLAVAAAGRLEWAQTAGLAEAETVSAELPSFLLSAEMDGVSTDFSRVLLAEELASLREGVQAAVGAPLALFQPAHLAGEGEANFFPPGWAAEASKTARVEQLKQRLVAGAVVYLLLVAFGFLYLAWSKRQILLLDARIARLQPQIQTTRARQERWETLAPALDWHRYTVEILSLVNANRPNDEVRITSFEASPGQFVVKGEAPSAEQAIDFAERLRGEKQLSGYRIEMGPPLILPGNHAQFSLFGRT